MKTNGFSLIELMIVIAIVGILATLGISLYQGYTTRTRIMEGIGLTMAAKSRISTDVNNSIALQNIISQWNSGSGGQGMASKYVESVLLRNNGEIEIKYNSRSVGLAHTANTLIISPWIRTNDQSTIPLQQAINTGVTGSLDWACASASRHHAIAAGMSPSLGTLNPEYAPANCR